MPREQIAAIVVNPTKLDDPAAVRAQLTKGCVDAGWHAPLWLETTTDDLGTGQVGEAVARGADVVCALGGDGTVRAVAAALVDTSTPMGLLPGGTANILARTLELPVASLDDALRIVLSGQTKHIDVGLITFESAERQVFLVRAGLGVDAEIMAETPGTLKRTVGWVAYAFSALKTLPGDRFSVQLRLDDGPTVRRHVRAVVVGNCGQVSGGVMLFPDARVDDGRLDAVLLAPTGLFGWAAVAVRVLTRQRRGHPRMEHHHVRRMTVRPRHPRQLQLDGDPVGAVGGFTIDVAKAALGVTVGHHTD